MLYPVKWARLLSAVQDLGGCGCSQSGAEMPRETTEEEEEEDDPLNVSYGLKDVEATAAHFEVVDERVAERVGVQSVHEDGRRDIGKT